MKTKRSKINEKSWIVVLTLFLFVFLFSEKGVDRIGTWKNLLEVCDRAIIEFSDEQVDLETEIEKSRVAKWISR